MTEVELLKAEIARLKAYGAPEFYVCLAEQHKRAAERAREETAAWIEKIREVTASKLSDDATIRALTKQIAELKGKK